MTSPKATSKNQSGFYIGVGCPGCGGELAVDSDLFVTSCGHCGSTLRILMPLQPPAFLVACRLDDQQARVRIDRYLKEARQPLTGRGLHFKRLYYPYWKVDAIMLKVRNRVVERECAVDEEGRNTVTVENPTTEITLSPYRLTVAGGEEMPGIPEGIGLRAEYLKLVPYSRENTQDEFDSLPIVMPWPEVWKTVQRRARGLDRIETPTFGKNVTQVHRPVASLIYFPYLVAESYDGGDYRRFLVDGVTGRMLHLDQQPPQQPKNISPPVTIEFGRLTVELHRCGNCGHDLPAQPSYVYLCSHCHATTVLDPRLNSLDRFTVVRGDFGENSQLFPFWSIPGKLKSRPGKSPADENLGRERVVVPAFRLANFEAAFRLSRRMSAAIDRLPFEDVSECDVRFQPVSIGPDEARLMAQLMLQRAAMAQGRTSPLDMETPESSTMSLFFAPFHAGGYFFVDSVLESVTFEKTPSVDLFAGTQVHPSR
jgi:ribosomal protein S27E